MYRLIFVLACCIFLCSCNDKIVQKLPDYSSSNNWVFQESFIDKDFDVFFMHPTTYNDTIDGMNASLHNPEVNNTSNQAVDRQASVFTESCNLYAPRYRQMSMHGLGLSEDNRKAYLDIAEEDMLSAFSYYLDHLNNGRPFILAGHSQGSNVILNLLLHHPELINKEKLVAAYLIGYSITNDDIEKIQLPFSVDSAQTACIISWNTIGENGVSPVLKAGALCVNPLSWNSLLTYQDSSKNLGARIKLANGEFTFINHFTSAKIDNKGGLIIPNPSIIDQLFMPMGTEVYHLFDYDFFYMNIMQNVALRCQEWKLK